MSQLSGIDLILFEIFVEHKKDMYFFIRAHFEVWGMK